MSAVSNQDVDDYLATVPEPQKSTLEGMRATLAVLLRDAEQGIAYGVPCFKVGGKGVAGFGFYKNHCTYFPMSGSITAELADDLKHYVTAKGSMIPTEASSSWRADLVRAGTKQPWQIQRLTRRPSAQR